MSFSNPLHLSGRQLENFNNTQKALQKMDSNHQLFQLQSQQLPPFGSQNFYSQGSSSINQNKSALKQTKQVSFSEQVIKQESNQQLSRSPPSYQQLNNKDKELNSYPSSKAYNNFDQPQQQQQQQSSFQQKREENPNPQITHSQENGFAGKKDAFVTIPSLEYQQEQYFNPEEQQNKFNYQSQQKDIPLEQYSLKRKESSSNLQDIKTEVDRLIMRAKQQNDQALLDSISPLKYQNEEKNFGRSLSNDQKSNNSSSSKKKSQKRKKNKKKKRKYRDSDDSNSSSDESDERYEDHRQQSYDEDEEDSSEEEQRNKRKKRKSHKKHRHHHSSRKEDNDNHSKKSNSNSNYQRDYEARSVSNYSRKSHHLEYKQEKKQMQPSYSQNLSQSNLRQLPSYGMNKNGEGSIYSSSSKLTSQQLQASLKIGFRRCNDESEEDIQNNDMIYRDFKSQKDFYDQSSQSKRFSKTQGDNIFSGRSSEKLPLHNYRRQISSDSDQQLEYNAYNQSNGQYHERDMISKSERDMISRISGISLNNNNNHQQLDDDNNVIFCINCEEYIKADKVDQHSNICQTNKKEEKLNNYKQYIEKINSKLIKIRFLIKNKHVHSTSSVQNNIVAQFYQQSLDLLSTSIETNYQTNDLFEVESQFRYLNSRILKINDSDSLNLLYFTQKSIEFVQRKIEFIQRYTNTTTPNHGANQIDIPSSYQNFQYSTPSNKQQLNHQYSDQTNYETFSMASSAKQNEGYSQIRRDPIQIFQKIDSTINIFNSNNSQRDSMPIQMKQNNVEPFNSQQGQQSSNISRFTGYSNKTPFKPMISQQTSQQGQSYISNNNLSQRSSQIENRQQSYQSQAIIEPVSTATIKEIQIAYPINNYNQQNSSAPYLLYEIAAKKQNFFQLAFSMKEKYPNYNQFLISELWSEAKSQGIPESDWRNYLINKFS